MQIDLLATTDQSISFRIQNGSYKFYFTAIYGCNEGIERRRLWKHLRFLHSIISTEPWMLSGDFNIITHASESSHMS